MNPSVLRMIINFRPNVIACRVNIASIKAETSTEECEAISELSAATRSGDKKLGDVVETWKLRNCVAGILVAQISLK